MEPPDGIPLPLAISLDEFFKGQPASRRIFIALVALIKAIGPAGISVSKSQIAFRREKPFAWTWMPGQYLKGRQMAPLVLSLSFPQADPSPRWKEVVEPARGRFMHHLELYTTDDLDEQVQVWLRTAWEIAGWAELTFACGWLPPVRM